MEFKSLIRSFTMHLGGRIDGVHDLDEVLLHQFAKSRPWWGSFATDDMEFISLDEGLSLLMAWIS